MWIKCEKYGSNWLGIRPIFWIVDISDMVTPLGIPKHPPVERQQDSKSKKTSLDPSPGTAWKKQVTEWRDKLEITPDFNPLGSLSSWKLCGLEKNARVTAILNLVACEKSKGVKRTVAKVKKATEKTIVDISQNPVRKAFTNSKTGIHHTLCSSTIQVHMGLRRIISPREMMYEQGHSPVKTAFPTSMPLTSLKKLAGQGMALPCVGSCLWSMFLTKGFPKPSTWNWKLRFPWLERCSYRETGWPSFRNFPRPRVLNVLFDATMRHSWTWCRHSSSDCTGRTDVDIELEPHSVLMLLLNVGRWCKVGINQHLLKLVQISTKSHISCYVSCRWRNYASTFQFIQLCSQWGLV